MQNKISKARFETKWVLTTTGTILLTMLVRFIWLRTFPAQPTAPVDAKGFYLLARNILNGHGFAIAWEQPFCPDTVRTPLYPLFLAFSFLSFQESVQPAILMQVLLEVLTCAITIRLGRDLGRLVSLKNSSWLLAGMLSGILYAINGTTQRYIGFIFSETLLLPLLSGAVLLTCRALHSPTLRKTSAAGLFWALSILTKPNVQFLALGAGLLLTLFILSKSAHSRSRLRLISSFWLVVCICLFPWLARNKNLTSRWMVSSAFEENVARVAAVATHAEILRVRSEPWTETWEHIYDVMELQLSLRSGWFLSSEPRFDCSIQMRHHTQVTQAAREFLSSHLLLYARVHLEGVVKSLLDPGHRLWYPALSGQSWSSTGVVADIWERAAWSLQRRAVGDAIQAFISQRVTHIPPLAGAVWWGLVVGRLVLWCGVALGLWRLRRNPWHICLLVSFLLYFIILPGPIAHDRFYMPAVPVVTTLTVFGLFRFKK